MPTLIPSSGLRLVRTTPAGHEADYGYTYDDGDNMTQKVEPFHDDFNDGNYTGWSLGSGWSAANGYMEKTSSTGQSFTKANTVADKEVQFSYMFSTGSGSGDRFGVHSHHVDWSNLYYVNVSRTHVYIEKRVGGIYVALQMSRKFQQEGECDETLRTSCDPGLSNLASCWRAYWCCNYGDDMCIS